MKFPKLALFVALISPVLISTANAQRGGGHGGGGGHAGGGVSHSSGGGFRGGSVGGFRGGTVGGFRGAGGFRGGFVGGRGYYGGRYYGPSLYLGGYGYPYYGYYGYDPYYSGYGYDPYAYDDYSTYAPAPVQQVQPGYQSYGYPQQNQVQQAPQQAPMQTQPQSTTGNAQEATFYLIAFNDHTIQAATAYKVDGDQIHWMTRDGQERQAPLSSVDVRFSQQINRDRRVDFQIP